MLERFKAWCKRMTPMSYEERRHAHRMILLSSCGGVRVAGKNGKMQIEHEKVSDNE